MYKEKLSCDTALTEISLMDEKDRVIVKRTDGVLAEV
jgi:hypothetical protein